MDNNVFLISDASYRNNGFAGLGIRDTRRKQDHYMSISNIKSPQEAEMAALLFSIKIALRNKYRNVVFVYDCINLPVHHLDNLMSKKFEFCQFLWLKRKFTKDADILSKKALQLSESITVLERQKTTRIQKKSLTDIGLINIFKSYEEDKILTACLFISSEKESRVIKMYLSNKNQKKGLPRFRSKNLELYKFIYNVLSKNSKKVFCRYVSIVIPEIKKSKNFKSSQKQNILSEKIKEILVAIKESKITLKKDNVCRGAININM